VFFAQVKEILKMGLGNQSQHLKGYTPKNNFYGVSYDK